MNDARQQHTRRAGLAVVAVILLAGPALAQGPSGLQTRSGPTASERPDLLQQIRFDQRLDAQVPLDLEFRDELGRAVRLGDYFGRRPVLLALVYYECPMLCTQVVTGLVSALDVLSFDPGKEFEVVVLSFDPGESPGLARAKKAAYMERYDRPGTEDGWHFLTGREDQIVRLADAVGFHYAYDPAIDQFAHAAGIVLLTPPGIVSRYFFGIEYAPRDLKFGIMEASENRVGSPVDQLLLFCYHYDPASGKYGLLTMNLVRGGGVVTVLALVAFWIVSWRRERYAGMRAH